MHHTHPAIGILGGTFDPIHSGHLRMAIELYEALELDRVHIIPCFSPVHRQLPLASAEERLAMVERAVLHEPTLYADPREIHRACPSYTIDTIIELRKEKPHASLCLLVGIDAFLGFASWHKWEAILNETHVIVAHRPHYQLPTEGVLSAVLHDRLQSRTTYIHEQKAGGILFLPISALEISASDIRKQFAMGRNPRYLLPEVVYDYIQENNIYRTKSY